MIYIIILICLYVRQCVRPTDHLELKYDMVTITLLLMIALFFILI